VARRRSGRTQRRVPGQRREEISDGRSPRFGPSLNGGFQSAEQDPALPKLDSVNNSWGIGVRMTEGRVESLGRPNPPQNRCIAFYYGEYESLGKNRLTVDARLQPDDVRIHAGVSVGLDEVGRFLVDALDLEALSGRKQEG
jgi:hypothetical protein